MKKVLFFLFAAMITFSISAQTVVFHENFEAPSLGDSLTSTADSAGFPVAFKTWAPTSNLHNSGLYADSNVLQSPAITVNLTTNSFSTLGNSYVLLEFSQICKLFINDGGWIEVSADGGTSWTELTNIQPNSQYQGAGTLNNFSHWKFGDYSYSTWQQGTNAIPTNSWWKTEKFNISSIAANKANVKIRFRYTSSGGVGIGVGEGRYGWLLDDIKVTAGLSELNPPTINMVYYPNNDTLYYGGPYNVYAYVTDASGVNAVNISYQVGNGAFTQIPMVNIVDSLYTAGIPYVGYGKTVNYNISAKDASASHNMAYMPAFNYYTFYTKYAQGGGSVVIGTGTSNQNYPFKSNANNTKSASLYYASSINRFGLITQLRWNVSTAQAAIDIPIKIYIKQTTATAMTADTWTNLKNGAILVYDGNQTFTATGWNTIALTTPFSYSSGNLMVLCEANYGGTGASASPSFYYSTGATGTHQIFASSTATAGTLNTSLPNITIDFVAVPLPTIDAGISQITNPTGSVTAGTPFNLNLKIKNFGSTTLSKATVYYSIDGETPVSSVWIGSLNTDSTKIYTAANLNLSSGIHSLKTWTTLPNDDIDQNSGNDTSYFSFYACSGPLNGSYTVGGVTADFPTFSDLFVGLSQCGINGPVVFYISPGTYSNQLTISEINGASATNTVTFRSATNDSTSVVFNHASTPASNWIVKLNGADYITFKNVKFAPSDADNSTSIVYANGATNNKLIGCLFVGYSGTTTNQSLINIDTASTPNNNNLFQGNYIKNGSYAISIKGKSSATLTQTIIKNNTIDNPVVYGIYSQYVDSTLIDSNTVFSDVANTSSKYGIYMQYGNLSNVITKNTVSLTAGTNMYGILTENCVSSDATKGLIANNFVSIINGTTSAYGIRLNTTTKYNVYANSVVTNGTNVNTRALNIATTSSGIDIKNNSLQSNNYPVYIEGAASVNLCDYNNYFSTGTTFAYWNATAYANLSALTTASSKDIHSISANPYFTSLTNLHTTTGLLKGAGTNLTEVTIDIDGVSRANPPCIGADEFPAPAKDAALVSILKPIGGCGLTTTEDVKAIIKNVGTSAILPNTMVARFRIGTNSVASEPVNRTINPGDTIQYLFSNKANLSVAATFSDATLNLKVWVDLTGDLAHENDSSSIAVVSNYLPPAPTVTNGSTLYATSTTLNAVSNSPIKWYSTPTILTSFFTGSSYTTPVLFQTTTYYVQATATNCSSPRVPIIATVVVPAREAGISAIITPSGCALNQVPISVKIFNHGSDTLKSTNTTVKYKLDDGSFITPEHINITINPRDTLQYTFTTLADFSAPTTDRYIKVTAYVMTPNDAITANDSLVKDSILSRLSPTVPTANNVSVFYGTSTTLNSSSTGSISWFDNLTGGSSIAQGNSYTTPNLFLTDTFYVQASNSSSFNAQVGTGTSTDYYLFYCHFGYSRSASLFQANEIGGYGLMNQIEWNISTAASTAIPIKIYLKQTTSTSMTADTWANLISGATLVYDGTKTFGTTGWFPIALTSPFSYLSGNLMVLCEANYGGNGTTPYPYFYTTATSTAGSFQYFYQDSSPPTGTGSISTSRPNIKLSGNVTGCTTSPRVPIVVTVSPIPQNDAGVTAIVNPNGATTSTIPIPIKVKIKNFGQAHLTSAKVAWKLNNVLKPDYIFTGNVLPGGDTTITIANETFIGGLYCMKVWTKNPNGALIDSIPTNDTASACFTACLNGVYTIGDTTGGNFHNYPTFNAAVTTLKMVGVCGNVTFLVDTGTYNEQVRISEIQGASAANTITFRSASNDSTKVKLQYNATTVTDYYTLRLDSADYITFKSMTIKATGTTYGKAVELLNHATYNTISNNIIEMPVTTSSYFYGIYDTTFASAYNKYTNNKILNGYYGIYTNGSSSTSLKKKNEITGNKILNFYYYGIYSYYQDSIKIIGNEINTNSASPIVYGLYAAYNNNASQILKNKVILSTVGSQYGISINNCIGIATARGLIANNMVALSGGSSSSTNYGLNPVSSNYQDFYNNSVNVSAPSLIGGRSLIVGNSGQNLRLLNNNFANTGGGYAFYVLTTGAVNRSNYNNIYTSGNVVGYWNANRNTLANLKTASSKDTNSVSVNPSFTSATDLHLLSTELSTIGTPISVITDDIDGNVRDVLHPTIGAHERALFQKDAGIVSIIRPNAVETENDIFPVKVVVKNFGLDPITTMTVSYRLNNGAPVNYTYNGNLSSMDTVSITFPSNMTVPAGNDTICAYATLTGDQNAYNNQICKSFWGTPLYDAQIATVYPFTEGCGLTNDTVKVLIVNQGIMPINGGLTVSYKKSGSATIVIEPVIASIPVDSNYIFKFSTLVNLSVTTLDATDTIKAWATLTNDHYHANDTNTRTALSLHTPSSPVTSGVTIPYATTATLTATSATNDSIRWYGVSTPSTALFTGSPYTTPTLLATPTTYYVEASTNYSITATVGPISPTTHGGDIGTQTVSRNANFTTFSPTVIKSVDIYPIASGKAGVIQVRQGSTSSGTLLATINYTTNVSGGNTPQTVLINYELPTTGDYNLYMSTIPSSGVSWDTSASAYPYSSYVAKITGNSYNPLSYIGMYNWKFGTGCSSSKVPVIVNLNPQPTLDASAVSITTPITAPNLSNHDTVRVVVINYGSSSFSNITMNYRIDNNAVVSEPYTLPTPLPTNSSITYTFTHTADLSSTNMPQTFNIMAWVTLAGDPTPQNDTTKKTVINLFPPYCTSSANDTTDDDIGNVTFAGINNGNPLPVLNNTTARKMYSDFTALMPGQIQPSYTYPISVSAIYSAGSWSGYCNVFIDYNRNGVFDLPSELAFGGDVNGITASTIIGTVTVPYYASAGLTRMRVVLRENGTASTTLPCGTYTYGETEDYTIKILPPIPHDGGIYKISINSFIPYSTPNPASPYFYLLNYGTASLANATINYTLNGITGSSTQMTISPALQSIAIDTVNSIPITLNSGINKLVAWTSNITGDTNIHNDTASVRLFKEHRANLPYTDNFDVDNYWYPTDSFNVFESPKNLWVQGVPTSTFPSLNAAHSPSQVWVTKLSGNYTANNTSFLYSPVFDISLFIPDTLRFWQWCQFGNGATGQIQYKNATGTWKVLGVQNDTNGVNWYNSATKKWTGVDTTWKLCKYNVNDMNDLGATVQFRFVFNSTTTATLMKGWAIDDFDLTLTPIPIDAGVIAITSPSSVSLIGANQTVTITVKNFGTDTLIDIPVKYQVGSGTIVSSFVPGSLAPGVATSFPFSSTFIVGNQAYDICAWTDLTFLGDGYFFNDTICKHVAVNPAASDVGIVQISEPDIYTSSGSYVPIKVLIYNYGSTTQTIIPLSYQRNNLTAVNDTFVGSISGGSSQPFTFATPLYVPNGNGYFLRAYTNLNNDAFIYNDTLSKMITICDVATAGFITGPVHPVSGSPAIYSTLPLQNATSYNWVYTPNPGTVIPTITNNGDTAILTFGPGTIGGVLSVNGLGSACSGTASTFIINPVGIDDIDGENFWLGQNMPNPTTGLTNVEYSLPTSGEINFSIMNLLGQKVYSFNKKEDTGKHLLDLNVTDLPAGFYYYTIEFKGKRLVKKMVVNK